MGDNDNVWVCLSPNNGDTNTLAKFRSQDKGRLSNGCYSILKRDGDISHF